MFTVCHVQHGNELDDKVTEREGSKMMPTFLAWAPKWMLLSFLRWWTQDKGGGFGVG